MCHLMGWVKASLGMFFKRILHFYCFALSVTKIAASHHTEHFIQGSAQPQCHLFDQPLSIKGPLFFFEHSAPNDFKMVWIQHSNFSHVLQICLKPNPGMFCSSIPARKICPSALLIIDTGIWYIFFGLNKNNL